MRKTAGILVSIVILLYLSVCSQTLSDSGATLVTATVSYHEETATIVVSNYPTTPTVQKTPDPTADAIGEEMRIGIEQGNMVVSAIEQYHHDIGGFPNDLINLVPKYLSQIPLTVTGQEFGYRLLEPNEYNSWSPYILSFKLLRKINTSCTYHPMSKEWECGPAVVP